jgi:hypothetical protein
MVRWSGENDDRGMGTAGEVDETCGVDRDVSGERRMHNLLVAVTFVLMVLSPCLVAMRVDSCSEE